MWRKMAGNDVPKQFEQFLTRITGVWMEIVRVKQRRMDYDDFPPKVFKTCPNVFPSHMSLRDIGIKFKPQNELLSFPRP